MYIPKEQKLVPVEDLKEHSVLRGFYQTNAAPELYLSKNGRVWSDIRETFIKPKPSMYRYPVFNSIGETYFLHVLLAETFIVKPESDVPLEVNHKDGNKNNFALDNLEWVTRKENVLHAVQTGLISKTRYKLLSKDLATGVVVEHDSLNACARFIGCDPASLSYYLKKVPTELLKGRYDVTYKGGRWNTFTPADVGRPRKGMKRAVLVIKESDKSAVVYSSAERASEVIGVCRTEISVRASGRRSPVAKGYRFVWVDEYEGNIDGIPIVSENPDKVRKPNTNRRKESPIKVLYSDGRSEIMAGVSMLAKITGDDKVAIQTVMRKNNGCYKDMVVTYL